jgi:hypothetical protein
MRAAEIPPSQTSVSIEVLDFRISALTTTFIPGRNYGGIRRNYRNSEEAGKIESILQRMPHKKSGDEAVTNDMKNQS